MSLAEVFRTVAAREKDSNADHTGPSGHMNAIALQVRHGNHVLDLMRRACGGGFGDGDGGFYPGSLYLPAPTACLGYPMHSHIHAFDLPMAPT